MPNSLGAAHFALLIQASPDGVSATDEESAVRLCTLARLGLLARHLAGVYVLTEAGRRYVAVELPLRMRPDPE